MYDIIALFLAIISMGIALFTYLKYETIPVLIEKEGELIASDILSTLEETLKPLQHAVSRAFSNRGQKGAETRQIQRAEALLTQDMMARQDPLIQAGLELFPNFKQYIEENPHLLPQLIPRLQALSQVPGFNPMDLINPEKSPSPSSALQPHPLNREL